MTAVDATGAGASTVVELAATLNTEVASSERNLGKPNELVEKRLKRDRA